MKKTFDNEQERNNALKEILLPAILPERLVLEQGASPVMVYEDLYRAMRCDRDAEGRLERLASKRFPNQSWYSIADDVHDKYRVCARILKRVLENHCSDLQDYCGAQVDLTCLAGVDPLVILRRGQTVRSIAEVLKSFGAKASKGSGLSDVLYQQNLDGLIDDYLAGLSGEELEIATALAKERYDHGYSRENDESGFDDDCCHGFPPNCCPLGCDDLDD